MTVERNGKRGWGLTGTSWCMYVRHRRACVFSNVDARVLTITAGKVGLKVQQQVLLDTGQAGCSVCLISYICRSIELALFDRPQSAIATSHLPSWRNSANVRCHDYTPSCAMCNVRRRDSLLPTCISTPMLRLLLMQRGSSLTARCSAVCCCVLCLDCVLCAGRCCYDRTIPAELLQQTLRLKVELPEKRERFFADF